MAQTETIEKAIKQQVLGVVDGVYQSFGAIARIEVGWGKYREPNISELRQMAEQNKKEGGKNICKKQIITMPDGVILKRSKGGMVKTIGAVS